MITWQWLAGFVDGEGCIYAELGGNRVGLSLSQSGQSGYDILSQIRDFLLTEGITPSNVNATGSVLPRKAVQMSYNLVLGRRADVARCLKRLIPHLNIKQQKAQDIIRFLVLFPPIRAAGKAGNIPDYKTIGAIP